MTNTLKIKNRFYSTHGKLPKNICMIITVYIMSLIFFGISEAGEAGDFKKVSCRVETEKSILQAGHSQTVIVKVTLDAPPAPKTLPRPPVNLSLVLDRSGSMSGSKLDRAKDATVEALKRLDAQDIFSLVVYDHTVDSAVPAQSARYTEGIVPKIMQIQPGGNTALFGGVSQGAAEIRKHLEGRYVHRIILLSDGLANVGPSTPEDLGRLGAALIKENISVSTIGVGTDYNEDLMARLSQNSDGNIYFVESSIDLPRIFTAELGDVLSVVARKVEVTIEMPEGMHAVKIIGREGRIRNNSVEISMNQLYGDQEKYALVEIAVPESGNGQEMEIARATVSYEDPFTLKNVVSKGVATARFSDNSEKVEKSANIDVVREYQLNLNALAQEEAIKLSDKGKQKEAVETLKASAAKLKHLGAAYSDDKLLMEADELEVKAEAIEKEGMSKKSRKLLRTDSYQMKNQQFAK
ncbi:von Willebrand factor type A domain protein [Desulfamplus magnetovallimortis]|uniref:von Willebrand factor type A domain protein n=1 Tax=Desulfamplus magnetovallimortis TaxID=1246637 RepID=A0A1W1HFQ6_9BACT|nr:VWA domain-containing protein [Desulfamplus magnetovallimortis]SLM31310.1 von Willebrand factor type A domain protein [Desulfamplus magnetovallimortis]